MPGSGRFFWRREWQPTPVFLPGKFHGGLPSHGGSDKTEQHTHTHTHTISGASGTRCKSWISFVISSESGTFPKELLIDLLRLTCVMTSRRKNSSLMKLAKSNNKCKNKFTHPKAPLFIMYCSVPYTHKVCCLYGFTNWSDSFHFPLRIFFSQNNKKKGASTE